MRRPNLVPFFGVALAIACDGRSLECGERGNNANVSGTWHLTAEGEREDCAAHPGRTEVKLRSARTLAVTQVGTTDGIDVLSLAEPIANFSFSGSVEGGCVDFDTHESTPAAELGFAFAGHIDGTEIDGDFTVLVAGDVAGPNAGYCRTEGSFDVTITPLPFMPDEDSGPQDDGAGFDGGGGDGGDAATGDDGDADSAWPTRECYTASDCSHGECIDYRCVDICQANTDCRVGETCVDGRCEEAPGCGCRGVGGWAPTAGALLALGRRRRAAARERR
jgi:hypothetical protein